MPVGIFLIWPALHLLYGVKEIYSSKVPISRRIGGYLLLFISSLWVSTPYGLEQGLFYWLFALMGLGLAFVQLRIWQFQWVFIVTSSSLTLFAYYILSQNISH